MHRILVCMLNDSIVGELMPTYSARNGDSSWGVSPRAWPLLVICPLFSSGSIRFLMMPLSVVPFLLASLAMQTPTFIVTTVIRVYFGSDFYHTWDSHFRVTLNVFKTPLISASSKRRPLSPHSFFDLDELRSTDSVHGFLLSISYLLCLSY